MAEKDIKNEPQFVEYADVIPPKNSSSKVWRHFGFRHTEGVITDRSHVECTVSGCNTSLKYCGNTTNLASHLKTHHPDLAIANLLDRKHDGRSPVSEKLVLGEVSRVKSRTSHNRSNELTEAIAYFLARDLQPVALVKGVGFQDMIRAIEPQYQLPYVTTFTQQVLPNLYTKTKDWAFSVCRNSGHYALTTDCWKGRTGIEYAGVTFHTISDEWEYLHVTLDNEEILLDNTMEHMAWAAKSVLQKWNLEESKLSGITFDSVQNGQKVFGDSSTCKYFSCFGKTLNQCIASGLKQPAVVIAVEKCWASQLLGTKEASGRNKGQLLWNVAPRWNNTYDIINRVLEEQGSLCATLIQQDRMDLLLNDDEFKLLKEIMVVLKPFKDISEQMLEEPYITVSVIKPLLYHLLHQVLHVETQNSSDSPAIQQMKIEMNINLGGAYQEPDVAHLLHVACYVDPRFKSMPFLSEMEKRQLYDAISEDILQRVCCDAESKDDVPPIKKTKTGLRDILGGMYTKPAVKKRLSVRGQIEGEMERYLQAESPDVDTNVMLWWKEHHVYFPNIAALAQKVLCITANSIPSERLFSVLGDEVNAKRTNLEPEYAQMMCFLGENLT